MPGCFIGVQRLFYATQSFVVACVNEVYSVLFYSIL